MFGLDSEKFIILAIIAAVVLGPARLQTYAKTVAKWIRQVRDFADSAQSQLSEEIGEEVDWRKLDPRQYDPRRIIREALAEPAGHTAAVLADEASARRLAATIDAPSAEPVLRLEPNELPPFDSEAT